MTFHKGHWSDLLELLLAHLGDGSLTEQQAPLSRFLWDYHRQRKKEILH